MQLKKKQKKNIIKNADFFFFNFRADFELSS